MGSYNMKYEGRIIGGITLLGGEWICRKRYIRKSLQATSTKPMIWSDSLLTSYAEVYHTRNYPSSYIKGTEGG